MPAAHNVRTEEPVSRTNWSKKKRLANQAGRNIEKYFQIAYFALKRQDHDYAIAGQRLSATMHKSA